VSAYKPDIKYSNVVYCNVATCFYNFTLETEALPFPREAKS